MLYYDLSNRPRSRRCGVLPPSETGGKIENWLLRQDAYTAKPLRRISTSLFIVNKVCDLWDLYMADMCFLDSHKHKHIYILNAIDAFSKYTYSVPICSKKGEAVVLVLRFMTKNGERPLAVRTNK
jgi:hypothetical protein